MKKFEWLKNLDGACFLILLCGHQNAVLPTFLSYLHNKKMLSFNFFNSNISLGTSNKMQQGLTLPCILFQGWHPCWFHLIYNLHLMCFKVTLLGSPSYIENLFNKCLMEKWNWIANVIKACLLHGLWFVYVIEAFTTSN